MIKYYETYDKKWFLKDSILCYMQNEVVYEAPNSKELDLLYPQDMCLGIIGDGCGGGRIFISDTEHNMIKVYDPETAEVFIILENLDFPKTISKKGCILFIELKNSKLEFDLSTMSIR